MVSVVKKLGVLICVWNLGQQETVDLQQQVLELGHKVTDLQTSVQEMKQASLCTGTKQRKSVIPKNLSVCFAKHAHVYLVVH